MNSSSYNPLANIATNTQAHVLLLDDQNCPIGLQKPAKHEKKIFDIDALMKSIAFFVGSTPKLAITSPRGPLFIQDHIDALLHTENEILQALQMYPTTKDDMPTAFPQELEMRFYITKCSIDPISTRTDPFAHEVAKHLYDQRDPTRTLMWLKNRFEGAQHRHLWPSDFFVWKDEAVRNNDHISHQLFDNWDTYVASLASIAPDFIASQLRLTSWIKAWDDWQTHAATSDLEYILFVAENTPGSNAFNRKFWEQKHLVWRELQRWHTSGIPATFVPFPKVPLPPPPSIPFLIFFLSRS